MQRELNKITHNAICSWFSPMLAEITTKNKVITRFRPKAHSDNFLAHSLSFMTPIPEETKETANKKSIIIDMKNP